MWCTAHEVLCDLLLLKGLPVATGKRPRELMRNIKLVRSGLLRTVAPQETLDLAGGFPDGQCCYEQLQTESSKQVWEVEMREGRRKFCKLLRQ